MRTEITADRLQEYDYPTFRWENPENKKLLDYAEIEINPSGIEKLESHLERCGREEDWDEKEWKELNNPESDMYEHVVAYVHFQAGTDMFDSLQLEVRTSGIGTEALYEGGILNKEEIQSIVDVALGSLHEWENDKTLYEEEPDEDIER